MSTRATPISTRKLPEAVARGITNRSNAETNWTRNRNRGERFRRSSKNPRRNMARANRNVYGSPPWTVAPPAARSTHPPNASAAAATIGTPPILGVGREWELRSLGTSIIPTRCDTRIAIPTPTTDAASEKAASPKVIGLNACTIEPSPPSPCQNRTRA